MQCATRTAASFIIRNPGVLLQNKPLITTFASSRLFLGVSCHQAANSNKGLLSVSRYLHYKDSVTRKQNSTFFSRIKNLVGLGKMPKSVARATGFKLYESIGLQVNYKAFLQGFNMPDTFHSWFVVTALHVHLLMARLMAEGEEGRIIRNAVVEAMWSDVEFKSKLLGEMATSVRNKNIQGLVDEFQASLFSYDEGISSDDHVLAGALWRNFFLHRDFDPLHLELVVEYVRHNLSCLDKIPSSELLDKRKVQWVNLQL